MILKRPILSEKTLAGGPVGKYVFEVDWKASKPEIASAISENFKVKVVKVNTIKVKSEEKWLRNRRNKIQTQKFKKAIVTLKKGQKIEGFEIKEQK